MVRGLGERHRRPAVGSGLGPGLGDAEAWQPGGALVEHRLALEDQQPLEHHVGAVRDDRLPVRPRRIGDRRRRQREVAATLVGADEELVAPVVDVVHVLVLARCDDAPRPGGLGGRQVVDLRGREARDFEQQVGLAARPRDVDVEALVLLLVEDGVGGLADDVAMQLERPLRVVGGGEEQRLVVGRPGHRSHLLGRVLEQLVRAQVADVEAVVAKPGRVDGVGDEVAVVADVQRAEGHELLALGELVQVQIDLLGRVEAPLPAAVDRVLLPLLGTRVVVEPAVAHRHREIRLLDPAEHLGVERVLQPLARLHDPRGVGVLRLEVGDDLGVRLLAQPEVVVGEAIPVQLADDRLLLGHRHPGIGADARRT